MSADRVEYSAAVRWVFGFIIVMDNGVVRKEAYGYHACNTRCEGGAVRCTEIQGDIGGGERSLLQPHKSGPAHAQLVLSSFTASIRDWTDLTVRSDDYSWDCESRVNMECK